MNKRTIKFYIPSLNINRAFLEALGKILNAQINRVKKNEFIKDYATFSVKSENEDLTFTSFLDLIKTDIFPKNISSMTFRITPYDDNYVNIHLNFDNGISPSYAILISSNQEKLLKVREDLNRLFDKYETWYAWFYKLFRYNSFFLMLPFLFLAYAIDIYLIIFIDRYINISKENILFYFILFGLPLQLFFMFNYEKLLPKFIFNVDDRKLLRYSVMGVLSVLLLSFIYDLIKVILGFKSY